MSIRAAGAIMGCIRGVRCGPGERDEELCSYGAFWACFRSALLFLFRSLL